jgi:hypothetical protein
LRPVTTQTEAGTDPVVDEASASRIFSLSILISAIRCTLTYVVFPWVLPLLGIAKGVGPGVGVTVGVIAIVFNILSIRRFQRSTHPWRRPLMALNGCVIALLLVLVALDVADLIT